jgi:hypothetical protein
MGEILGQAQISKGGMGAVASKVELSFASLPIIVLQTFWMAATMDSRIRDSVMDAVDDMRVGAWSSTP